MIRVKNWSTGGVFLSDSEDTFQGDRIEEGEMLMPCADGIFILPVQIQPLHRKSGGLGCQFVDMPPRERAILHAYADFVTRGQSVTIALLEDSARTPLPTEPGNAAAEPEEVPRWRRMIGPGMMLYGWRKSSLAGNTWRGFWRDYRATDEIISDRQDKAPVMCVPLALGNISLHALRYHVTLPEAFLYDHDWDGTPV